MQFVLATLQAVSARAQAWAEAIGGPGLVLVAFVDSSFVTLPEVADLLVVLFTVRSPAEWFVFAGLTTAGSLAGSYALYLVGRRGGEAILRRRFHERHVDRGLAWFRRYGALALIVPAMLPPPMPFKAFVLLAGVSGVSRARFLAAVAVGRGVRYGGEALLARWYGPQAVRLIQQNAFEMAVPVLLVVAVGAAGWWFWRRQARVAASRPADPALARFALRPDGE